VPASFGMSCGGGKKETFFTCRRCGNDKCSFSIHNMNDNKLCATCWRQQQNQELAEILRFLKIESKPTHNWMKEGF